jgi:hypothetical protein
MKHFTALLSLFVLLLYAAQVSAATEYDFEIIIFEDKSSRYANSEQWQHELPESGTAMASPARRTGMTADGEMNISKIKGVGLEKYARKLKTSKRYKVLVHKAWRQTGLSQKDAFSIPIDSRPASTAQAGKGNNIHGTIKIVLGRYLHIYTDMIYQQPRKDAALSLRGEQARLYKEYPIKSHRRMRSKELHYLDHPMVGILVMAMPVKKKEEPKEET